MPTFLQIRDSVTRRLIDANVSITTEVSELVNNALKMIQDLHNFKIMEAKNGPIVTVQASRILLDPLPTDWKDSRDFPWIREWDGGTTPIQWAPSQAEMAKIFPLNDSTVTGQGKPQYVVWDGEDERLEIQPFPDTKSNWAGGGDWRVVVPYWKYLPALVANEDTNWFTNNASEFLRDQAVAEGFYINWDEERAQLWEQRAAVQFQKTKKVDKRVRINYQATTLTPRFATRGSFRRGR